MYQYAVVQAVLLHQVLLSRFLSRLRAENARSKVAYVKGIVKYIFKRVFWEAKRGGRGGGTLLLQLFAPASAAPPHMFLADKCGKTFDLFFYIYIY